MERDSTEAWAGKVRLAVALIVVIVWAVIYLRDGTSAPPEASAVMLAVVAWLFGTGADIEIRRRK